MHPRFAHMVMRGAALGSAELAAVTAACLSERDVLRGEEMEMGRVGEKGGM